MTTTRDIDVSMGGSWVKRIRRGKIVPPSVSPIHDGLWVVNSGSHSCYIRFKSGRVMMVPSHMLYYFSHYVEIFDTEMG